MRNRGNRIKERRKALHMSADELADIVGYNRATIYRYIFSKKRTGISPGSVHLFMMSFWNSSRTFFKSSMPFPSIM